MNASSPGLEPTRFRTTASTLLGSTSPSLIRSETVTPPTENRSAGSARPRLAIRSASRWWSCSIRAMSSSRSCLALLRSTRYFASVPGGLLGLVRFLSRLKVGFGFRCCRGFCHVTCSNRNEPPTKREGASINRRPSVEGHHLAAWWAVTSSRGSSAEPAPPAYPATATTPIQSSAAGAFSSTHNRHIRGRYGRTGRSGTRCEAYGYGNRGMSSPGWFWGGFGFYNCAGQSVVQSKRPGVVAGRVWVVWWYRRGG